MANEMCISVNVVAKLCDISMEARKGDRLMRGGERVRAVSRQLAAGPEPTHLFSLPGILSNKKE